MKPWRVLAGRLKQGRSRAGCNRQLDIDDRRALAHPHDVRPGSYLQGAEKNERVVGYTDGGAIAAASEDWRRAVDEHGIPQAVVIARDNDTRAALNTAAGEQFRTQGQRGDLVDYRPVTVAVGDRIICRRNDHLADVERRHDARDALAGPADRNRRRPAAHAARGLSRACSRDRRRSGAKTPLYAPESPGWLRR